MKKMKILFPILGVSSIFIATTPLMSCGKQETVTIEFQVAGRGTLSSNSISIPSGSKWSDIEIPTATPNSGYVFMGWFIGNAAVKCNTVINDNTVIYARFMQKIDLLTVEEGDGWEFDKIGTDEVVLRRWPKTAMLVVPNRVKIENEEYNVTGIDANNSSVLSIKSFYIPETVTDTIIFPHPLCLGYINVDAKNPIWTSKDGQGKHVNCLIKKDEKKLVMGCTNSIIPNTIEIIGDHAFDGVQVDEISIPESIKEIQEYAFFKSTINSIFIPKNVTTIGDLAFALCKRVKTIIFDPNIGEIEIGKTAFGGCSCVTSIVLPESLTKIERGTFAYCTSLKTLHIGSKVNEIDFGMYQTWGDYPYDQYPTFYECNNLETIEIDSKNETYSSCDYENCIMSVNNDGKKVLHLCTNEKMPFGTEIIEQGAFAHNTKITNINIPSKVISIGDYAFTGCPNLTSVSINDSLEAIGYGSFCNCPSLKDVSINNDNSQLKEIRGAAFYNCPSIKSFFLPKSIKSIGTEAFSCFSIFDNSQINYGGTIAEWENVGTDYGWCSWQNYDGDTIYAFRYVKCIDGVYDLWF